LAKNRTPNTVAGSKRPGAAKLKQKVKAKTKTKSKTTNESAAGSFADEATG